MHDDSQVMLRKVPPDYDPTDRDRAYAYIRDRRLAGEVSTGLLYVQQDSTDMMEQCDAVDQPMTKLPFSSLCPGSEALEKVQKRFR